MSKPTVIGLRKRHTPRASAAGGSSEAGAGGLLSMSLRWCRRRWSRLLSGSDSGALEKTAVEPLTTAGPVKEPCLRGSGGTLIDDRAPSEHADDSVAQVARRWPAPSSPCSSRSPCTWRASRSASASTGATRGSPPVLHTRKPHDHQRWQLPRNQWVRIHPNRRRVAQPPGRPPGGHFRPHLVTQAPTPTTIMCSVCSHRGGGRSGRSAASHPIVRCRRTAHTCGYRWACTSAGEWIGVRVDRKATAGDGERALGEDVFRLAVVGQIVRRRWRFLTVVAAVGALLGASSWLLLSPGFAATSMVVLHGQVDKDVLLTEAQIAQSLERARSGSARNGVRWHWRGSPRFGHR